ncbi:hypothetical protein E2320_022506, partial [Naja naja]
MMKKEKKGAMAWHVMKSWCLPPDGDLEALQVILFSQALGRGDSIPLCIYDMVGDGETAILHPKSPSSVSRHLPLPLSFEEEGKEGAALKFEVSLRKTQ